MAFINYNEIENDKDRKEGWKEETKEGKNREMNEGTKKGR